MPVPSRCRAASIVIALTVGASLLSTAPATAAPPSVGPAPVASAGDDTGRLLLLLDASGSMKRPDPSGLTKIEAAKKALTTVVGQLPADARVGLRVYGARVDGGGRPTKAACADTRLEVPVGPLDRAAMTAAVTRVRALGETPIATSLQQAVADLGTTGRRTVVLVSDGQESCVPDPCPVVRKLLVAGVDLRIDTVGFGVDARARKQLRCIAAAGGGSYYDAADADQLADNLSRLSVRAARQFGTTGTRVAGTAGPEGAPVLGPGLYVDTFAAGGAPEHFVLRRSIPRSTLHVSVVARPGVDLTGEADNDDTIRFEAQDEAGRPCTNLPGRATRIGLSSLASVVSDSITLDGGTEQQPAECGDLVDVPMTVARSGSGGPVDAELLVIEEPPVTDEGSMPPPAEEPDPSPSALGAARPVVGGPDFGSATPITPGTWREQYVSGETIYYRFPVEWGQSVKVTAGPVLPTDGAFAGPLFDANLFDPTRGRVSTGPLAAVGRDDARVVRESAPLRYRNREDFPVRFASLEGQYYLAVSVPKVDAEVTVPMDVTFRLEVSGTPEAGPAYAQPVPSTEPSPSTAASSTPPEPARAARPATEDAPAGLPTWVLPAGLGALAVVLVGAATGALVRARRRRG